MEKDRKLLIGKNKRLIYISKSSSSLALPSAIALDKERNYMYVGNYMTEVSSKIENTVPYMNSYHELIKSSSLDHQIISSR